MAIAQHEISLDTFDSLNPATGEVIASFPVHDKAAVDAVVARARPASEWWGALGYTERKHRLQAWKGVMARRIDELVELMHLENGKPREDATLEVLFAIEHLDWAARKAKRVLGRHYFMPTALTSNYLSYVEYQPLGVVGVIGPWNYPVHTPMGSISYALAAGNAVVFKPSELTPAIGQWLVDTFNAVVAEQPVLQLITGDGSTGAALCRAGVDKIAFTGSESTGRKVMEGCAETLTPVTLELGGKDAMIVDADADLESAARAAVFSGMSNAGQTCIGTERVYVVDEVYDEFVEHVLRLTPGLTCGTDDDACYGPITMPSQIDHIRDQLEDALDKGAKAVLGGLDSVRPPFVDPVVLVDVPDDAAIMHDETFGPIIPIGRVRDADEALDHANSSRYGLASIVFAKKRAKEIASKLKSGATGINASAFQVHLHPALPFGGVGDSGFGRIHGADGLREFTHIKSVTRVMYPLPKLLDVGRFDRHPKGVATLKALARLRPGRS
jgi:acyl-CoA reductase-like NAD-dependent aldehyde dehydrogenase